MKQSTKTPRRPPSGPPAPGLTLIDLDENGNLLDSEKKAPLPDAAVPGYLAHRLHVPENVTDIVVFVHGWQNTPTTAAESGNRLASLLTNQFSGHGDLYPAIGAWNCHYVIVRWPSMSNPMLSGYRRIRERAHQMSTSGRAADVIAQLLGYLNRIRSTPAGPAVLRTRAGQYLHCVGHSFGGRFLLQAVIEIGAAKPTVLGWNRADPRYPYAVDTLLVFQMAAAPDIFTASQRFTRILTDSPVNGPLVLTHSTADRATGLWHRLAEGRRGIGAVGVLEPAEHVSGLSLRSATTPYRRDDFPTPIVNVDASARFRHGRWSLPQGAHSDYWYPESAHLILSLANLAR